MSRQKDPVQKLIAVLAENRNEYFKLRRMLPPIGDPTRMKVDLNMEKTLKSLEELLYGTK